MSTDNCTLDPRTCGYCVVGCDGNGFGESGTYPSCSKAGIIASMLGKDICRQMLRLEHAETVVATTIAEKELKKTDGAKLLDSFDRAGQAVRDIKTDFLEPEARTIVEGMLGSVLDQLSWGRRQAEWALEAKKKEDK